MRSFPVDPITIRAEIEFIEGFTDPGRQAASNIIFFHTTERSVACKTPDKWMNQRIQIEPLHDLQGLLAGLVLPDQICVRKRWVLHQPSVLTEQRPPLVKRDAHQLIIVVVRTVENIKTEKAQVAGKLAEMHIQHEPRHAERAPTYLLKGRDIEGLENWVNTYPVTPVDRMLEIHGAPIHKNQIYF